MSPASKGFTRAWHDLPSRDRKGLVLVRAQGQDCFGTFMEWGLPKEVLREIWALAAGQQGQLDARQFISCVYLMDSVKKVCYSVWELRPSELHLDKHTVNTCSTSVAQAGGRGPARRRDHSR